jgi:hypothetical protein
MLHFHFLVIPLEELKKLNNGMFDCLKHPYFAVIPVPMKYLGT